MLILFVRILYSLQVKLSYASLFLQCNGEAFNNFIVISQLSIVFGRDNYALYSKTLYSMQVYFINIEFQN